jgi:hypothetical protein
LIRNQSGERSDPDWPPLPILQVDRKTPAILVMKDLFDAQSAERSDPEGERQAWIEFARLDGVDGLAKHIKGVGQLGLRPVTLGAQRRNRKLSYPGADSPCRRICIRLTPILTHRIPRISM